MDIFPLNIKLLCITVHGADRRGVGCFTLTGRCSIHMYIDGHGNRFSKRGRMLPSQENEILCFISGPGSTQNLHTKIEVV